MTVATLAFDPELSRHQVLRHLMKIFAAAGLDAPTTDARLILCGALGIDHAALIRDPDRSIGAAAPRIELLAARRMRGEPLSRILGHREFWGLDFALDPSVLDPRPETEILIEAVLTALADRQSEPLRILDLGIGSGAILAALLHELPEAYGVGVDRSESACRVARDNLEVLRFAPRASVLCGDWTKPLRGEFDAIVANPPYIKGGEIAGLAREVREHDPRLALDGGEDGLVAYRAIVPDVNRLLRPCGIVALEVGAGQSASVSQILAREGFAVRTVNDLAGQQRIVMGFMPEASRRL